MATGRYAPAARCRDDQPDRRRGGFVPPASLGPNDTLTLYGKREARPGRKMGHITRRLGPRKD
ncbi:hypothetical protein [Hyphomonas sp.]|uniref:hypothetical protein n=1 Tax=Hyphomonas sp. TaxID=87 RepID=UPI0034A0144F